MNIKKWADDKYNECKETINEYIKDGMDKVVAVKIILSGSTLGAGYKAQLRRDFDLSMFD